MNFEMWIVYMLHEICLHHQFYLFRGLVPMLKPFQLLRWEFPLQALLVPAVIALVLLLRHFWTLNFSSLKQRKGNNIYKLTQTWNSECSSYKYSMWQRTNVRTLRVCLQQRSSKVTWNYTWNLMLRRWITTKRNQQHGSKSSNYNPQVWPFEPAEESLCFMKGQLECQQRWKM